MLCCVHLTVISLSILKVLRVPLSFRCLIFKVLRTFWKVFCRFLPNLSQQCVNYYITLIFVCQHFFQTFLKSFLKSLSKLFKSFTQCFQTFLLFLCFPQATLLLYHALLQIATPFFNFFQIFLNFLKKWLITDFFGTTFFKKAFIAYKYTLLFVFYTLDAKDLLFILL